MRPGFPVTFVLGASPSIVPVLMPAVWAMATAPAFSTVGILVIPTVASTFSFSVLQFLDLGPDSLHAHWIFPDSSKSLFFL